jgi:hypothetical protein
LQKPCQDGNLKFGIQKQTKPNPKPYLYIEMWAFFLSKHLIFFRKTSKIFPDWSRFFLIDPEENDENKSVKKLRRCVIFYSLILLYITLYNFQKKRNLLTNKNIKTFVCWKLLHKYVYSSYF